jgi:REP element-mobilizing transposase RayT
MPRRRFKMDGGAVYHCITRTVGATMLLDSKDLEVLRRQLWQAAEFCGVQVLTYCLLSNHFHVLVRVPPKEPIPDHELVRRYRALHPRDSVFTRRQIGGLPGQEPAAVLSAALARGDAEAQRLRKALTQRMGDVSEFMKTLKQRFSIWYNQTHDRFGTLWAERFKSLLVEDDRYALSTVAAYIDLNPVRAKLVDDPKDYRFCGYAEALGEGGEAIRAGLRGIFGSGPWAELLQDYRTILFGKGGRAKADGSDAGMIPPEQVRAVLAEGGRLPMATVLRCRVRYFTDGAVLGSPGFVSAALGDYQRATGRRHHLPHPAPMAGADWPGLATLRRLRSGLFG